MIDLDEKLKLRQNDKWAWEIICLNSKLWLFRIFPIDNNNISPR